MWPFKKKVSSCPEGATHMWKDIKGYAHDSVEQRDAANARVRYNRQVDRVEKLLVMDRHELGAIEHSYLTDDMYICSRVTVPALMRRPIPPVDVAKMLIQNWPYLKEAIEEIVAYEQGLLEK